MDAALVEYANLGRVALVAHKVDEHHRALAFVRKYLHSFGVALPDFFLH